MPDQQALIHWDEVTRTQTLAIETRFEGEGEVFAWVVPVPSVPQVSETTTGLFPTLQVIFQPGVISDVTHWWVFTLFLAFMIGAAFFATSGNATAARVLFYLPVGVLLVVMLFLPALSTARRSMDHTAMGVTVHERQIIGGLDVATISSDESTALLDWLRENDFAVPNEVEPVIADYVTQGWVFVAAKLQREAAMTEPVSPQPLVFRFQTDAPVYPMRLTGVTTVPLTLDLYVFGPRCAAAPHMTVARCSRVDWDGNITDGIPVEHAALRGLVAGAAFGTRLSGTLTPEQMASDLAITFSGGTRGAYIYTPRAARITGWNVALLSAVCAILFVLYGYTRKHTDEKRAIIRTLVLLLPCALLGVATALFLPQVDNRAVRVGYHPIVWRSEMRRAAMELVDKANADPTIDPDAVIAACLMPMMNPFTGKPVRREDSPGNYILRETGDDMVYELLYINEHGKSETFSR